MDLVFKPQPRTGRISVRRRQNPWGKWEWLPVYHAAFANIVLGGYKTWDEAVAAGLREKAAHDARRGDLAVAS